MFARPRPGRSAARPTGIIPGSTIFRKNHGRAYALAAALAWMIGVMLNNVLARLRGQRPVAPRRFFRDFWAAGLRPLLGLPPRGT